MDKKVVCPYCGYGNPVFYSPDSNSEKITIRCKGRKCRKEFEIKIVNGKQVR